MNTTPTAGCHSTDDGTTHENAAESLLPPLTRGRLTALCDTGTLSPEAWKKALQICGFNPDGKAWLAYWRQIFLLGGALFFLAGVICFIAWNWGAISPFGRMALIGSLVAGTGVGAVLLGPDARLGGILLLACGISMGPMLAVFGQSYQTGTELWELFRVWTVLLCLLALAGKQAGLWFATWISGSIFAALWFGRSLSSPLDAFAAFFALPEWLLVIACAIIAWEWAAWRAARHTSESWLRSRWMPRLLFCDLAIRCTAYLLVLIFDGPSWGDESFLWLPQQFVSAFTLAAGGVSWWWYRKKVADLFILAVLLGAATILVLAFLPEAQLFFHTGAVTAFLLWGLLVTGVTACLAKFLLYLQKSMAAGKNNAAIVPAHAFSFLGRSVPEHSWQNLWTHLQNERLIPQETPLPHMNAPLSPWYVRLLLALGGWLAAILFICFLAFFVFETMQIIAYEEAGIFIASIPVLLLGRSMLVKNTIFSRHFGFALAITGTVGMSISMFLTVNSFMSACFLLALLLVVVSSLMQTPPYTFLAAMTVVAAVSFGTSSLVFEELGQWQVESLGKIIFYLPLIWWVAVSLGLARFCLHEKTWRGRGTSPNADAWFFGAYAGMLICQLASLGIWQQFMLPFPALCGAYGMGMGAALGIGYLAISLSRKRHGFARAGVLLAAAASFVLAWHLPGAALALLGLALARQMTNMVMQGFVLTYLLAYMIFYYYTLAVPFAAKALYLTATGIVLLLLALSLRTWSAKITAKEAADA